MARRQDHHAIPPAVPSIGACRFVFWLALAVADTGLHLHAWVHLNQDGTEQ